MCHILTSNSYESGQLFDLFSSQNASQRFTNDYDNDDEDDKDDTAKQNEKEISVDWMGLIDDSIVICVKVDEKVKDIDTDCEAVYIVDNDLNAVIIQLNLAFISALISIRINFFSGAKSQLLTVKLDLDQLCSSKVNRDVLRAISQMIDFELDNELKAYLDQILLLNKLNPKLDVSIVEPNTLRVYYLKDGYLQIVHNWLKEILGLDQYSNLIKKQKVKSNLKKALVEELLYCNQLINGDNEYHKMRRHLLSLESSTDSIIGAV